MKETAPVPARALRRLTIKQVSFILGGLAAGAAIAAIAASVLLTAAVLNNDLAAQIRRTTGFSTWIGGPAHFALLPQPHIAIENIRFSNPQAALQIDAARFTGYLRLLPLLAGRVEVGHAVLYQPKMVIDVDDQPVTPDSAIGRAANAKPASPEAAATDRTPLAIVDFVGGSARLHHRAAEQDLFIDDINVTADWRSLNASATLTGGLRFRNVPMQVKAWIGTPVELLRDGESAATLQLESDAVKAQLSGRISAAQQFQYKGSLALSTPSLRAFAKLAGLSFAKHGRFGNFDLRGDANVNAGTATLTNLRLRLDGNDYEGTLAVQADGQTQQISGTLATNFLDATPFLEGLPRPLGADGQWSEEPLELADLGFTNLDLRLSASRLRLHDLEIKDVALSVLTRPGFIDLALGEARANGGTVHGRLSLSGVGNSLDLRASASAKGIDLQPMLRGDAIKHPLAGALNGSFMIESKGRSFAELMRGLSGHAEMDVANGQLTGLDLAAALREGASAPLAARGDPNQSTTDFDTARFGLQIDHGVARVTDGRLNAQSIAMRFGGTADLGHRMLDLWALARPAADQADAATAPLRLLLTGSWDRPQFAADRAPAGLVVPPADTPGATPKVEQ